MSGEYPTAAEPRCGLLRACLSSTGHTEETPDEDSFTKIEKLEQLKEKGLITDGEFEEKKEESLNDL